MRIRTVSCAFILFNFFFIDGDTTASLYSIPQFDKKTNTFREKSNKYF